MAEAVHSAVQAGCKHTRFLLLLACLLLSLTTLCPHASAQQQQHSSNYAVLVSSSRSWRNYRHSGNLLAMYRTVKRLGIPDSNIITFLADDHACNPRNPWKASLYKSDDHALNVYGDDVEVDYRGYEVTIENLLRVLTGRHDPAVPKSKRLLSDRGSNVLLYMTGHGGDEFLKFQDVGELLAQDLADALDQMAEKGRYNELLLMVDTCEAHSMTNRITAPRVITMASSLKGESSYSYRNDYSLGQALVDRFTHLILDFAEKMQLNSRANLQELANTFKYSALSSHYAHKILPGINRTLAEVKLIDFFGGVSSARLLPQAYPLNPREIEQQQSQQSQQEQQQQSGQAKRQHVSFLAAHDRPKQGDTHDWLVTGVVAVLAVVVSSSSWFGSRGGRRTH